jgi:hypothetical protein
MVSPGESGNRDEIRIEKPPPGGAGAFFCVAYFPAWRRNMNEGAKKILERTKEVIRRADVQPGYPDANGNTNVTWCNRAAYLIATGCGGDMRPFLEARGIGWTRANDMYNNAVKNAAEVSAGAAQDYANAGKLVLAAAYNPRGPGHVAIVCPAEEEFNPEYGPLVGEAGARCRITHSRAAFEKWGYAARFFLVPAKAEKQA